MTRYWRPRKRHALRQNGRGVLGSLVKFAVPALKRLAPVVTRQVKKHAPRVVKSVMKAGIRSASAKRGRKKSVFKDELQKAVIKKLVGTKGTKKKRQKRRAI